VKLTHKCEKVRCGSKMK